jgi:hypothetical protein
MTRPDEGRTESLTEQASRSLNIERFFESKRAAAVFKHAILSGYVVPFASKTGSSSAGNRVVIVDGYAGAGRYDVNIQAPGLGVAVRDGRLRFGGGRGVTGVAERGFGDDSGP